MKYVLDCHAHTAASGHAYESMQEMMAEAAARGLEIFCITEHAPQMPGSAHEFYFSNMRRIDREYYRKKFGGNTRFLIGCEANILSGGTLDLKDSLLKEMDIVIASMHAPCLTPGDIEENTYHYVKIMENPYVHIIGHPDDSTYPVDMEVLVREALKHHKILEVNNSSLKKGSVRKNALCNDRELLKYCLKYGQPVVVGSDAHTACEIGGHQEAYGLFAEIDFPEELVLNSSSQHFSEALKYARKSV